MIKYILYLLTPLLLLTTACNDIATDDRYIEVDKVDAQRVVLIEDFTGQNCVNCPAAHVIIDKLVEQYGDAVIPVSIHAGGFGIPATNTRYTGLMQPEGDTYNDAWGINEWPKGVVNRSGGARNPDEWAEAVRTELARPTPLTISLDASYSPDSDCIAISTTLDASADLKANLQLWVLEDGIIARQQDINLGRINDYCHNHVYRASVNGVGGQAVSLKANIHSTFDHTISVKRTDTENWNTEQLTIVAFVYDDSGVIQAAKSKVK